MVSLQDVEKVITYCSASFFAANHVLVIIRAPTKVKSSTRGTFAVAFIDGTGRETIPYMIA